MMKSNRALIELKNIGKKLAGRLNAVGIFSEDDLRKVSPVGAHNMLKAKYPDESLPVCYYLYSFEGALSDTHWNDIGEQTKQDLKAQLEYAPFGSN